MFPTASKFFEVPADFTFWQLMNSQFLATFAAVIVAMLVARYGSKTAAAVTDSAVSQEAANASLKAQRLETQEESEESKEKSEPPDSVVGKDYRNEAKELVKDAKDYIGTVISGDLDGRRQRTYAAIGKADYIVLAVALNERKQLTDRQLDGAVTLFSEWKSYERGRVASRAVPEATYTKLKNALSALKSSTA
jgi:hypothetical protein